MKVLHIVASINPALGGVSQAIITISKGLQDLDIQNEILSLDSPSEAFLKGFSPHVHAMGPGFTKWNYNSKVIAWLLENVSKFDALIIHGMWLYHGYAVNRVIRYKVKLLAQQRIDPEKLPMVCLMPHGMLDPYFQLNLKRRLKAIRNKIYWGIIENKVVKEVDKILFTSDEEKLLAQKTFKHYKPKDETVVGLGVDFPPRYNERMKLALLRQSPKSTFAPYILFLGRIDKKKGIHHLIEACKNILDESQVSSLLNGVFRIIIAGPGWNNKYGKQLKKQIEKHEGLQECIIRTGMLRGDAKWGALYNSSLFILPSSQENFGIALVEAMACGKAVITTNQVNIWKEIDDSDSGIIATPDTAGVEQAIRHWLSLKNDVKHRMNTNARQLYCSCYTPNVAALKLRASLFKRS